jgi:ABC-type nitrate/sulfonate/bicarbonate transport system substrate-binding protein
MPLNKLAPGWIIAIALWASVPAAATPIAVAAPSGPVSLPLLVAIEKQMLRAEGLEVVRIPCLSGRACLDLLRNGTADVATSAEFAVATTTSQASDLVILASMSESSGQIKVIANRRAGVRDSADLVGKRVATVQGTSAQYFLDQWLVFKGIDPRRVVQTYARPDALGSAIQRGDAAAVVIWEPEAGRIEEVLGADAVRLPAAHVYRQHFCVVARASAAEQDGQRFQSFLRGLLQAERFIAQKPAEARAILAANLKVSTDVAERLMAEQDYRIALRASLPTTMLSQVRWFASQGSPAEPPSVGRSLPIQHLIYPRLLQSLAPNAVTLTR